MGPKFGMGPGCWTHGAPELAALHPFAGRFQKAKLPMPNFPPQGTRSLVLFLCGAIGGRWANPRAQLTNASPVCTPPSRGEWHLQSSTPHLPASPPSSAAWRGLDKLAAQWDPARPAHDTLLSSNSPWQGQDKAGACGDTTAGKGSAFCFHQGAALAPTFFLGWDQKKLAIPPSPHSSMAWHHRCSQHRRCVSGFNDVSWGREAPHGGDGDRHHGEDSMRDHQEKLWRHWESSLRNLCPQHPTLLTAFFFFPKLMIISEEDDFNKTEQAFFIHEPNSYSISFFAWLQYTISLTFNMQQQHIQWLGRGSGKPFLIQWRVLLSSIRKQGGSNLQFNSEYS